MKSPLRTEAGILVHGKVNKREAAVLEFAQQCQVVTWDFSKDGGAVGDVSFGVSLPAGAIVTGVLSDVETTVTGATAATLKAGSDPLTSAIDLTAASDVEKQDDEVPVKLAAASELKLSIATNAATAGKVSFYVLFVKKP